MLSLFLPSSGDLKSMKVHQNVKYDSETGKVYEELGSTGSSCNPPPTTSESNSLTVNSASSATAMINGGSPFQNGSSFQARNLLCFTYSSNLGTYTVPTLNPNWLLGGLYCRGTGLGCL